MKVFLDKKFHPDAIAWLKEHAEVVDNFDHPEELDGILMRGSWLTGETIEKCTNLKVIGRHGVGYEKVDVECAKAHGVHVLNVPRGNAHSVAELIVALIMSMSRRVVEANIKMRAGQIAGKAPADMQGHDVEGRTFGVIGMGNISCMAADMMRAAFGVKTIGYDPFLSAEEAARRGFTKVETVEELVEQSDFISISVHLNDSTRNLIGGEMFNHFKPDAVLVNTARGGIINEDDLYEALKAGKLGAAACDVFVDETNYAANKLLELPNFSATPHLGGNTEDAIYRTSLYICKAVVAAIEGTPLNELENVGIIC